MGQAQLPEHGPLLGLVRLHPPENIVQNPDCTDHIGSLIEHDALGAPAHRRICDLGARRLTICYSLDNEAKARKMARRASAQIAADHDQYRGAGEDDGAELKGKE